MKAMPVAQSQCSKNPRQCCRGEESGQGRGDRRPTRRCREQRGDIGCTAKESSLAERHQAGMAHQQVEAERKKGEVENLGPEIDGNNQGL